MILTVTLNAALDVTYRVGELRPHQTHRVTEVTERPGGKGVNVAAVLHAIREPAVATGLAGGATGDAIRAGLAEREIPEALVPIAAPSRRTVTVVDGTDATGFWEPGPPVTGAEWDAFLVRYQGLLRVCRAVALSGSLPLGLPDDAYPRLVGLAVAAGVPSVVDTAGPALRDAVAAGPTVVKPNLDELAGATGMPVGTADEVRAAAEALRAAGAGAVVVSRGPDGLLASTPDGVLTAAPPAPIAGNPTGAGDAAVAALARGLAYQLPWSRRLAEAVGLSAAAVAAPAAGEIVPAVYDRLRREVPVQAWEQPDREGGTA